MKWLVLLGDGMADFPQEAFSGRTPLAVAHTPAMDSLAESGISGLFCPIPDGFAAGSDIGNLSLFGYDPAKTFTGRAPLEAANQGIQLGERELAFRCNLVTLRDDTMEDFTAGHISTEEASELIMSLNESLAGEGVAFHTGVSYRHLTIVGETAGPSKELADLSCTPPHDIIGQCYAPHLPKGASSEAITGLMERSRDLLHDHPVNEARRERGELPANSIWLWGQGGAPTMETYQERFNLRGAVISAVDLVNGIGRCAGFEVIHVPGATGYVDTDYEGKTSAAQEALGRVDFVYLHVEAPDEASHEGDAALKIRAIEDFDSRVVSPCLEHARAMGDCRVLVAPDHVTSLSTRTHAGGPVPFALCGPGVGQNGRSAFSEEEGAKSGVLYPNGHELVVDMITKESIG